MNDENRKEILVGLLGTLLLHGILFLLLWFLFIRAAEPQAESGVPVLLGSELLAQGDGDKFEMTEVDVMPEVNPTQPRPEVTSSQAGEEIISQDLEETVAIEQKKEEEKTQTTQPQSLQPVQEQPKEKTEAELKAEAEKAAAEAAARSIAGAFGKGASMENRGESTTGAGIQGSVEGNSETGMPSGTGGYGSFDLNGRTLGEGGLPRPDYTVQDEGRVVVTIIVNPAGQVVGADIHRRTNTMNATLRKAALDAARKARFNAVNGVNNQSGTITYYFKLK